MNSLCKILFFLSLVLITFKISAQSDTSTTEKKSDKSTYRRARTATIMSAVLPGAGQVYNRKYWKLPIIYAGLGGFGYLFIVNQRQFTYYSDQLRAHYDEDPSTINNSGYTGEQLQVLKGDYRKNRDLGIIGCMVIYALNILDANVDAHLKTFDVSDNLSLQIKPYGNFYTHNMDYGFQTGIALNFKIK